MEIQKTWLRSLEDRHDPEYAETRFDLIAGFEEEHGKFAESNVDTYRVLTEYHEMIAEKYKKAERNPWLPVEADPPPP